MSTFRRISARELPSIRELYSLSRGAAKTMTELARIRVDYDPHIPEQDKQILESRRDVFVEATGTTDALHWTFVEDVKGCKYYQLRNYSRREIGYVELTLDEIGSLDDAEIKAIVIQNERPCVDVEKRIEEWIIRLEDLYQQVESWLQECPDWTGITGHIEQLEEELMRQRGVSPRDVPTLVITNGSRDVKLLPSALWIVGANGKVDVLTPAKQYVLFDLAPDDAPNRNWQIVVDDYRRGTAPFDKQMLLTVLEGA